MFCPQCGNNLPDDAQFCGNCGAALATNNVSEKETQTIEAKSNISLRKTETIAPDNPDVKVENNDNVQTTQTSDMRAVIGKNADYYLKEFAKIDAGGKASFNIAAFFLTLAFCLYRKCGKDIGRKYLLLPFIVNIASAIFLVIGSAMLSLTLISVGGILSFIGSVWLIIANIRLELNFNSKYYKHCQTVLSEHQQTAYRTSVKNVVIFIAVVLALSVVLALVSAGGLLLNLGLDDGYSDDDFADEEIAMYFEDNDEILSDLQNKQVKIIYFPNKSGNMSDMDMYKLIMNDYSVALSEHWNVEQLEKNALNYQLMYYSGNDIGYTLLDINNDGTLELIISLIDYEYMAPILDLYTINDNQLVQVISASERDSYNLLRDGTIYNLASSSALDSYNSFYELDSKTGALKLAECFIYNESIDSVDPWFYYNANFKKKLVRAVKAGFTDPFTDIEDKIDYYYLDLTAVPFDDSAYWEELYAGEVWEDDGYYMLPGSDSRYIDESELYGFSAEDCRIARNELYARHGRKFNSADLQDYFNAQGWYVPTLEADAFSDSMFNEYEKANRDLILAYEKAQGYR